jgi:hypothetical protein
MPVLENARYELFAQSVANGKLLDDAYADAGYKPNQRNSSRLRKLTSVDERIAELLNERANKVLAKTAREAEVTRDSLLEKLEKAYDVAQKAKNGSAMTMSVIGMARICGLIIDRREVGQIGAFDNMTDEELWQEAKKRAEQLGLAGPRLVVSHDVANDEPNSG